MFGADSGADFVCPKRGLDEVGGLTGGSCMEEFANGTSEGFRVVDETSEDDDRESMAEWSAKVKSPR